VLLKRIVALVIAAGCDDFVRKPFREEVIWQKMSEYLGLKYIYADNEPNQPNYSPVFLDSLQSLLKLISPDLDWTIATSERSM
jgi:two-component system sensor histidine kinase/response regulator